MNFLMKWLCLTFCLSFGLAWATDMPSANDIASKLAAPTGQAPVSGPQSRSLFGQGPGRGITVNNAKPEEPAAIDLNIHFEFDSARLTNEGSVLVGNLGRALKDPRLVGKRFRIEGHTDGQGSQAYNQALSERRAAAVRRELMAVHGVDPAQLDALGLGKSQLLDPSQPLAAANRRVRVINLGGTP